MNILSAVLCLVAVILEFIILFCVKDLQLYGDEEQEDTHLTAVELLPISTIGNAPNGIDPFVNVLIFSLNGHFFHFSHSSG